jgi:hypothetical protein
MFETVGSSGVGSVRDLDRRGVSRALGAYEQEGFAADGH